MFYYETREKIIKKTPSDSFFSIINNLSLFFSSCLLIYEKKETKKNIDSANEVIIQYTIDK